MLLFLLFGLVAGDCTGALTFGVTGINPLYDNDTTTLWAGACGYKLRWCPYGGPDYITWTIVEKSTGRTIQTFDIVANYYEQVDFCFSPGSATLNSARDYSVQITVNQVTYSSALYYAKQVALGITKPSTGSSIVAGEIFDLVYSFQYNAPVKNIDAFTVLAFSNGTRAGSLDSNVIDSLDPPAIGYVQQRRISVSRQPGDYFIAAGLLDLYKRETLVRIPQTQTGIFRVICPSPPCNNVPFPPAPPPVPVVIQTPVIQPPPPAQTSKANWFGLF